MEDVQAVVLMGGLGTRLGLADRPKAMADVHGHPFFDYQLQLLKSWGICRFLFLIGYMGDMVRKHYGDGTEFGVRISYAVDGDPPKGTGGALRQAISLLDDDFLLLYGDSFMDIDYQEMMFHYMEIRQRGKKGLMAILQNRNSFDRSNVVYKKNGQFLYDKQRPSSDMEYIDYGVSFLSRECFAAQNSITFDLADLFAELSQKGLL